MTCIRRFLSDDRGQDLVEYVLLGATVALAGLTVLNVMPGIMSAVYTSWETQREILWYPNPPAS